MPCSACKQIGHNIRTCPINKFECISECVGDCPICFKELYRGTNYIVLKCGHDFCASCIFENQNRCDSGDKCPMCREHIVTKNIDNNQEKLTRIYNSCDENANFIVVQSIVQESQILLIKDMVEDSTKQLLDNLVSRMQSNSKMLIHIMNTTLHN
jgi:hypothetical protein